MPGGGTTGGLHAGGVEGWAGGAGDPAGVEVELRTELGVEPPPAREVPVGAGGAGFGVATAGVDLTSGAGALVGAAALEVCEVVCAGGGVGAAEVVASVVGVGVLVAAVLAVAVVPVDVLAVVPAATPTAADPDAAATAKPAASAVI